MEKRFKYRLNFAKIDRERFGTIEGITDKEYYSNSYHIDDKDGLDMNEKLKLEAEFQKISEGGEISYINISNIKEDDNKLEELKKNIYENSQFVELKT